MGDARCTQGSRRNRRLGEGATPGRRPVPISAWWNQDRLHGQLGHVPPVEFEAEHCRQISAQPPPLLLGEPSLH